MCYPSWFHAHIFGAVYSQVDFVIYSIFESSRKKTDDMHMRHFDVEAFKTQVRFTNLSLAYA